MLKKLPIYLKENNTKLLIKYDGERNIKKYTIKLLYNDIQHINLGSDTDSPNSVFKEIFKNNNLFEPKEILFFFNNINTGIEALKNKFGDKCIISVIITEENYKLLYTIHIQITKGTKYISNIDYKKLYETLLTEEI